MQRRSTLLLVIGVFLLVFFGTFAARAQTTGGDVTNALERAIQEIEIQIAVLQTRLNEARGALQRAKEAPATPTQTEIQTVQVIVPTRSLALGSRGDDVRELQKFLSQFPDLYPEQLQTGFYGPRTAAAVRKFQERHNIESVGSVGPKTLAKISELLTSGAGKSVVAPPGLAIAPGIQKQLAATTTVTVATSTCATNYSLCYAKNDCEAAKFFWYTMSCHQNPPPTYSCAESYSYCINPTECSKNGWYWCRNSCYPTLEGCQGQTYVAPATPAAIPTIPVQPITQTGTTTVPTVSATTTSSTATTTVSATAPVFTITSPNGGEQWTAGNTYTFTWTSVGTNISTVNIDLYKSGSYSTSIASSVSNTGRMDWTIPSTIFAGSGYKIRIYSTTFFSSFDESDSSFSIIVPVTAPSVVPIGYWKFDGNGNNEIAGGPSSVTVGNTTFKSSGGKFGGYLYIPNNNDYAKIPYHSMFDLPNSFTVEFWFRQRSNQSFNQNLVYKGTPINNYNFNIFRNLWNQYNNGTVIAGSTAAGTGYWHQVSNNNEPPHNAWHHVVYTKTTEGAAYYIDGVIIHSRSYSSTGIDSEYYGPVKTPAVDIIIGNPAPDTDIDNLRIYNYALSRGEVLYNWENVPGSAITTTTSDTIAPSVPTNLTATAVSPIQINLSWSASTDNVGVTGYRIYRGGAQIATTTSTAYSDTGLTAATTYSYAVVAYDIAGNISLQSVSASATTFSAGPPAPTNFDGATSGDIQSQPPRIGLYLVWKYTLQSATKAFNVYMKKPSDVVFIKYTYSDPANLPIVPGWLPLPVGTTPSFYRQPDRYMWRIYDQVADTVWEMGKYEFYVTVTDNSGAESAPTVTKSFTFYRAPTIVSPANGSTVSVTPRITVTEDSASASLGLALYKNNGWIDVPGWWPALRDFTYNGPALATDGNPHRLIAYSVGGLNERSLNAVSIFNVSTTTATTTSFKARKENLAAISEVVGSLNAALDALIQLLKRF